eukprot:Stramenopile-MAST_4_protein_353
MEGSPEGVHTLAALFKRLATLEGGRALEKKRENPEELEGSGRRCVAYDVFMAASRFAYRDGFSQFDAYRAFASACNQKNLHSDFNTSTGQYTVPPSVFSEEEVAMQRIDETMFTQALQICGKAIENAEAQFIEDDGLPDPNRSAFVDSDAHRMELAERFAAHLVTVLPVGANSSHFDKADNFTEALVKALNKDFPFGAKLALDVAGVGFLIKYEHSLQEAYLSFIRGDPLKWPSTVDEALLDVQSFSIFIEKLCEVAVDSGQSSVLSEALEGIIDTLGLTLDLASGSSAWIKQVDGGKDSERLATRSDDGGLYPQGGIRQTDPALATSVEQSVKGSELRLRQLLRELEMDEDLPGSNRGFSTGTRNIEMDEGAEPHQWHPMPCIIREVLRAPDAPLNVENLMEAALAYHNQAHYDAAQKTYSAAREVWKEEETYAREEYIADKKEENPEYDPANDDMLDKPLVPPRAEIFLLCSIGSVYESAGDDEMALSCYMEARTTALATLDHNDCDVAVAYSHIGSVCFHLGRYELAYRCFSVAFSVRERALGPKHPDTASLYSNLGCCLCLMGRKNLVQARHHLRVAEKILKETLGPTHIRTATVRRNVLRVKGRTGVLSTPMTPYQSYVAQFGRAQGKRMSHMIHSKKPLGLEELRLDTKYWKAGVGRHLPAVKSQGGGGSKKKGKKKKKK